VIGAPPRGPSLVERLLRQIAASRVYEVAHETPLVPAPGLSRRLGIPVLLKREDLQRTFSFKIRGAYNRVAHLSKAARRAGVIAASAGNHAQGVAFAAHHLGLRAVIVMPETTPSIKVEGVRALGAEIVLFGDTYAEAAVRCATLAAANGMTMVHAFDDLLVIAGQGTVGMEVVRQAAQPPAAIFVPVGGGGLLAGVTSYVKSCLPAVQVIGVEPLDADAMHRSLAAGRRVRLDRVGLFADGVAVHQVGEWAFALCRETVDGVIRVGDDEICAAIRDIFDETRTVVEPSGALSIAGLKAWARAAPRPHGAAVAILSGANMDFDRLRLVAERAALGEAASTLARN
jgi:threonine dehydratase